MNFEIRRITQILEVSASSNNISEVVNASLRDLSRLYDMKVESIIYDDSTDPMIKSTARILYSYIGTTLDDEYDKVLYTLTKYDDINDLMKLLAEGSILTDPYNYSVKAGASRKIPISELIDKGYKFKKGDVIIL